MWALFIFIGIAGGAALTFPACLLHLKLKQKSAEGAPGDGNSDAEAQEAAGDAASGGSGAASASDELEEETAATTVAGAEAESEPVLNPALSGDGIFELGEKKANGEPLSEFKLSRGDVFAHAEEMAKDTGRFPVPVSVKEKKKKHYCDVLYCGKWCFALMYERRGEVRIVARLGDLAASPYIKPANVKAALFPRGGSWYGITVDRASGSKEDVFDILDACYDSVLARYYRIEGAEYVTDAEAAAADALEVIGEEK